MKPIKYNQKQFKGIVNTIDPTDIPETNCLDCSNIDINTIGQLSSMLGSEKQITTGLGYDIDCIHQLYKNGNKNIVFYNGIVAYL